MDSNERIIMFISGYLIRNNLKIWNSELLHYNDCNDLFSTIDNIDPTPPPLTPLPFIHCLYNTVTLSLSSSLYHHYLLSVSPSLESTSTQFTDHSISSVFVNYTDNIKLNVELINYMSKSSGMYGKA